jgi:hypothetical protein
MSRECPLIAVVDDEPAVRTALRRLLDSAGIEAKAFATGEQFLASLDNDTPDCLVLDLHMPEMTGFDVLARACREAIRRAGGEHHGTRLAEWGGDRRACRSVFLPQQTDQRSGAARGHLRGHRALCGKPLWQGRFSNDNKNEDGFERSAPAKSFPPNGYGLYDMTGNVWEWCADWFDATQHEKLATQGLCHNPAGPARSFNPREPHAQQRVTKGGSFLCAENYCLNYRPSARRGTDYDTGMSRLGFRCVLSPDQRDKTTPEKPIKAP